MSGSASIDYPVHMTASDKYGFLAYRREEWGYMKPLTKKEVLEHVKGDRMRLMSENNNYEHLNNLDAFETAVKAMEEKKA